MSEFLPKDHDRKSDEAVSNQPLEMTLMVSPVLKEESDHSLGAEHIINGYDHIVQVNSEKSQTRRSFSRLIVLTGVISLLAFLAGEMFLGLLSLKSRTLEKKQLLSQQFPGLERTFESQNSEIIAALKEMARQGNTPAKFFDRSNLPKRDIAKAMEKNFRSVNWEIHLEQFRANIAREPWHISFQDLKKDAEFLSDYQKGIIDIRRKINHSAPVFTPEFDISKHGFNLKTSVTDDLWGYVHMEEYEIARALLGMTWSDIEKAPYPYPGVRPSMHQAVESLANILEIAHLASVEKDIALRLHAAYIRENAFDTLQQLVNNPEFKQTHAQKLFYLLCGHLKLWPSDALEMEGERMASFYIYEAARKGDVFSVMMQEDENAIRSVSRQQDINALLSRDKIDEDQAYYLRTVREILDCSGENYFRQKTVLDRIEQEILTNQQNGNHHLIADFLLLRGIQKIRKILAVDRERVDEMVIALGITLRLPIPHEATTDPVNGKPFVIREFEAFESNFPIPVVTVCNVEGDLSFTMPTKLAVISQR